MLNAASVEQLLAWSSEPALLVRVQAGPLRGRRWQDLDDESLVRVLVGEFGQNPDMLFTARTERARRCLSPRAVQPPQLQMDL